MTQIWCVVCENSWGKEETLRIASPYMAEAVLYAMVKFIQDGGKVKMAYPFQMLN